jgi:hypothetical protein
MIPSQEVTIGEVTSDRSGIEHGRDVSGSPT